MSDLGSLLQKARKEKGISLDDLQEVTKIRKRYLEAIEDGSFHILPGNFYARAFIKSYSEAVGLDPDEVMHLYRNEIPSVISEPQVENVRRKTKNPNSEKWSKWASLMLVIAFPLLIVGIIYYFFFYTTDSKNQVDETLPLTQNQADLTSTSSPRTTPTPTVTPTPTPTPKQTKLTLLKTDDSTNTETYQVTNSKQLDIELKLSNEGVECWAAISKNNSKGEMIHQVVLGRNGVKSVNWSFAGSAYLNIGRADSVELTINGQKMDMGSIPNPKRFQLNIVE